jgi:antitoxin MazE
MQPEYWEMCERPKLPVGRGCKYIVSTMPRRSSVKGRIVAIGNSQGVRIPKPLLEQAGLTGEVELHAEDGRIVIAAARQPRAGWAAAAAQLHARGEDRLLETPAPAFDAEGWEWR